MRSFKVILSVVLACLLANTVEAATRAGRAVAYSTKFRKSTDNTCGITSNTMDRRFATMYAAVSVDDLPAESACGKCISISGVSGTTSRRFNAGVFAKIVDVKSSISSGELLLSSKALKVSSGSEGTVSWTVVDCPPSTNLRGRKLSA